MKYTTDDIRITGLQEVIAPLRLIEDLPLPDEASRVVFESRAQAANILNGRDARLLVVVGPCSIHDPQAALEYAERLLAYRRALADDLLIIMRVYFEKPRTTVGWKGLINDPDLNGSFDINKGLHVARRLLIDIVRTGLAAGTEYLDPITPQYLGDVVSWGAIGARTTESQVHRQLASGLSCPIGFKNNTDGSIKVAVDAVKSALHPHIFLSITKEGHSAIFSSAGNPDCHVILRGGSQRTNYDPDSVAQATALLNAQQLTGRVMVDMSHANSHKDPARQRDVCQALCDQLQHGSRDLVGVMIESHLVGGRQDAAPGAQLTYGQSITDGCLAWDETTDLLEALAQAVRERRALHGTKAGEQT